MFEALVDNDGMITISKGITEVAVIKSGNLTEQEQKEFLNFLSSIVDHGKEGTYYGNSK